MKDKKADDVAAADYGEGSLMLLYYNTSNRGIHHYTTLILSSMEWCADAVSSF